MLMKEIRFVIQSDLGQMLECPHLFLHPPLYKNHGRNLLEHENVQQWQMQMYTYHTENIAISNPMNHTSQSLHEPASILHRH
jgi:hypothetical protein